jgi:hypothetical protein
VSERKEAVAKDPHMRLMLKLLSFEREEAEIGQHTRHYSLGPADK